MKHRGFFALTCILAFAGANASASGAGRQLGTLLDQRRASEWNQEHSSRAGESSPAPEEGLLSSFGPSLPGWPVLSPFSEAELTGYVVISDAQAWEMEALRDAIAANLPRTATLVIYVISENEVAAIQARYPALFAAGRLKFLLVPNGQDTLWARDSLPVPVYLRSPQGGTALGLVDSIYPQHFEPGEAVARAFEAPRIQTHLYFRGGNLLSDPDGNCFAERALELAQIANPTAFLTRYFGCGHVTVLEQEGGIGDIDERIKFLSGRRALTDNENYARILRSQGYQVFMMPRTGMPYETYLNSLLVNDTVFVPQMGLPQDKAALEVYRQQGLNAIPVHTKELADIGNGNIHCVTMNYPYGTFVSKIRNKAMLSFR